MSDSVQIPIDILHRPEVRAWDVQDRSGWVLRLWLELGALTRSTGRIGFLPASAVKLLGLEVPQVNAAADGPVCLLKPVEGGWECPLFVRTNTHLDPHRINNQRRGSLAASVRKDWRRGESLAAQELPLLPIQSFVYPDGSSIPLDTVRKARALVRLLDNTLGLRERTFQEFPPGLCNLAAQALRESSEDQVNQVAVWILHHRNQGTIHPAIPATTERALENWQVLVDAASPENTVP